MTKKIPAKKVRDVGKIDAADAKPIVEETVEVVDDYADPKIQQQVRRYLREAEEAVDEGNYTKAVESYDKAEKDANYPENYKIPRGRADIWKKSAGVMEDRVKKRQYYLQAIEELKNSRETIERERGNHLTDTRTLNDTRNSIVSLEEQWKKEVVDLDLLAANELLTNKEYDGALDKLKTALQLYEKHSIAWKTVAKIHEDLALTSGDDAQRSEHVTEAFRAYNKAIEFAETEGDKTKAKREKREGAIRTILHRKVGEKQNEDGSVEKITFGNYFKFTHGDLSRILDGKKAIPGSYDAQLVDKKEKEREEREEAEKTATPVQQEDLPTITAGFEDVKKKIDAEVMLLKSQISDLEQLQRNTLNLTILSDDHKAPISEVSQMIRNSRDPKNIDPNEIINSLTAFHDGDNPVFPRLLTKESKGYRSEVLVPRIKEVLDQYDSKSDYKTVLGIYARIIQGERHLEETEKQVADALKQDDSQ